MAEDYLRLGKYLSVCLAAFISLQAYWLYSFLANPENPTRYEILAGIGYTSLFSIVFWVPGLIVGYLICDRLGGKTVGIFTVFVSTIQAGILIWILAN